MVLLRHHERRARGSRGVMDEILEPKEVAKLLKVHQRTVVRWAEQGKLPGFKLGDLWRFRREAIEEHIRQLEKEAMISADVSSQNESLRPSQSCSYETQAKSSC
jgi:excisionase family DNA binding protein